VKERGRIGSRSRAGGNMISVNPVVYWCEGLTDKVALDLIILNWVLSGSSEMMGEVQNLASQRRRKKR